MVLLFKIWSGCRTTKIFVSVEDKTNGLYETVLLKASRKMDINGSTLVLEADGTIIDDDEILKALSTETMLLLQPNEVWKSSANDSTSTCTTVTISSDASSDDLDLSRTQNIAHLPEYVVESQGSQNSWKNFKIPWDKISTLGTQHLDNGQRNEKTITEVIHVVANEIRAIRQNIPAKYLKIIAEKICQQYPKTFEDRDDDGEVIGDGFHGLFHKLQERIKYLNRSSTKRQGEPLQTNIPLNKKKKMLASKAGCSNWNPPEELTENNIDELKQKLKLVDFESNFDTDTLKMLEMTYSAQRQFLNSTEPPSIEHIFQKWPILLCKNGIYWHFNKLMSKDITNLSQRMLNKCEKLVSFGLIKKYITTIPESENEKILATLRVISTYFSENLNYIYIEMQNLEESEEYAVPTPFIVKLKNPDVDGSTIYHVLMEKRKLNNGTNLLKEVLHEMFALYYNFNLVYPKPAARSLEFLQIYFLKIRPEQGSKNLCKTSQMKLLSLMNKLRD